MPTFEVTYTVFAADISEVLGKIAYPDGEPNADELKSVCVKEVQNEAPKYASGGVTLGSHYDPAMRTL